MKQVLGILGLLVFVCAVTALASDKFLSPYNLQNTIRWTGLFGILSIGVAFVIISGGIDLSIGSLVGLVGCLLPWLMVRAGWSAGAALALVLSLSMGIGLLHGLLVTKLGLQPFVVTLCGLLFYRGFARFLTADQTQSFGSGHTALRELGTSRPCSLATLLLVAGAAGLVVRVGARLARRRRGDGSRAGALELGLVLSAGALALGLLGRFGALPALAEIRVPTPFLVLLVLAVASDFLLRKTLYGRYLFALGRNELAARYSGIRTDRVTIMAYVLCSFMAGLGGVLFALDLNSVQPAGHGNFYELYAIAAAVLGGCSLRGGEGSILGVVIGAAVIRVLYNSINLLAIPTQLEFAIIGAVILLGVTTDELVKRLVARRRARARQGSSSPIP